MNWPRILFKSIYLSEIRFVLMDNYMVNYMDIICLRKRWRLWFFVTFVPKYGLKCMSKNYIYDMSKAQKRADR